MPKLGNKVVNYSIYARENNTPVKIDDTTSVQLPSIEMLTDTIKGAGIMGEIDYPTFFQPGSMSLEINIRVSGEKLGLLASAQSIEVRWITDVFDTNDIKVGVDSHKAFMKCTPKKLEEGKLEPGSPQDGSFEYEVFTYKRITNGKEILNIDKFNNIFAINGKNVMQDVQAFL
ncbi:phage tail tube protein FII [Gottschalkia purinilytica]|uniref:Phage tail tube protein FII n=1 Tax=Gottschalkia purinilytica TaxID=1503 RepID=A0A0L0WB50_GOTPU|nr:phage major tail tube protein [Gottschalkia purinilytica]KNF08555.1 phage tail tube protein FII [Gottschalkia purinilytica]